MRSWFAAAALATALIPPAGAHADGIRVAMQLEIDGQRVAAPAVWVASGTQTEVELPHRLKIALMPTDVDGRADIRCQVYADEGFGHRLIASPRMLVQYDRRSVLAWTSSGGRAYGLTLEPSLAPRPDPR